MSEGAWGALRVGYRNSRVPSLANERGPTELGRGGASWEKRATPRCLDSADLEPLAYCDRCSRLASRCARPAVPAVTELVAGCFAGRSVFCPICALGLISPPGALIGLV